MVPACLPACLQPLSLEELLKKKKEQQEQEAKVRVWLLVERGYNNASGDPRQLFSRRGIASSLHDLVRQGSSSYSSSPVAVRYPTYGTSRLNSMRLLIATSTACHVCAYHVREHSRKVRKVVWSSYTMLPDTTFQQHVPVAGLRGGSFQACSQAVLHASSQPPHSTAPGNLPHQSSYNSDCTRAGVRSWDAAVTVSWLAYSYCYCFVCCPAAQVLNKGRAAKAGPGAATT